MAVFAAVYSGIGTQWAGMGRELFAAEPAFAEGLREFDAAFKDMAGWSVEEYLYREAGDVAPAFRGHPCIVAVSLGLTALLRSRGFTPSLCVGHSGGEVAAACASGALDAKQAARVAREHSLILSRAGGSGKMLHLSLPGETAARLIAQTGGEARAAALNSPFSTVCSGPEDILSALAKKAEALAPGSTRFLRVDVPFHSPAIEHLLGDFSAGLGDLEAREPGIPLVSSLRGALADVSGRADFGRDYWVEHIRQPVRFADAMAAVLKLGYRRLVEISPHAVLQAAVTENASALGLDIASTALMARQTDSRDSCGAALAIMASWDKPVGRAGLTGPAAALAQLPPERRKNSLEELVLSRLGSLLARDGWSPADRGTPFQYLGLTSISALRLARGLTDDAGIPIPVSEIFNHPTVNDLAARLAGLLSAAPEAAVPGAPGRPAAGGPIAVVGAACRLPGGIADLDSYWRFLGDGRDAVVPIPAERWDRERYYDQDREKPGKMYTREAAFLTAPLDGFDSFFFMVSDQEASQMDPQQRLLLELAWEAFEQAGINPAALRGGDTAVFTALTESDYRQAHRASYRRGLIDAYSLTGTSSSGACGRLSYFFGFEGPCWSVDTACSSSLVALHCACGSLRAGECGLALVASASLMLTPDLHICFSKLGAISPDGRSKSFDDLADGYGRGEGGAAVLLKRLADAERDGDDILGLILGSAVNQDGRSNGLTAPNGLAQRKVIDRALAAAGLSPLDISFVEAHGTGTALGDAIELDSLAAAYCRGRKREFPLRIGSVKANIGHLEPAAGLASLIKVLLCLRHRAIPANIHVKTPNSRFDFAGNAVEAPTALAAWESDPRDPAAPRRAGLSAFGFSGVNGHAIVGEYLPPPDPPGPGEGAEKAAPDPDQLFLPLSAKTPPALRELASRTAEMLRGLDARDAAALCRAMGAARPSFPCRLFGLGGDGRELAASLEGAEIAAPAAVSGPVLLFTGQGSQYPGMGKVLYELYPAFRVCLDSSFAILSRRGFNAGELLFGAASAADLEDTALAQPLIAAVSYALLRLWESFGLRCSAVLGHSIGEYPAAAAAGIMSQEDMLALAEARGRIMRDAPAGAMAVVFASGEEVLPALAPTPEVVVAAVNSPRNLTLSGPIPALDSALAALGRKGIGCKRLRVSGAFHSPAMREAADRFADAFAGVKLGPPGGVAFISSLDGRVNPGDVASPDYWLRQILSPVRFADGLGAAAEFSRLALEVGPSAALTAIAGENAGAPEAVASLSPGQPALRTLFAAAGRLFRQGVDLDFAAVFSPFPRKRLRVPGYPFQRRSHWLPVVTDPPYASAVPASAAGSRRFSQALGPAALFESVFDSSGPYFVQEHVIFGQAISPAAGHLAMLLAAARDLWGETPVEIREADFLAPLVLGRGESRLVQIVIDNPDVEESRFKLVSAALDSSGRPAGGDVWRTHCTGLLSRRPAPRPPDAPADQCAALAPPADFGTPMAGADFYRRFTELGYDVGRGFQRIADIRVSGGEAICRVEIRRNEDCEAGQVIYPGALDSILQTMMTSRLLELTGTMRKGESLFIPMRLERLTLW
ncbi:MAG: acyltransferase domain-containing protein, partial [Planctomycetota bacterium]|nr:acyltransferase domain-containing protein [Planctomycetota bacterium]